MPIVLKPRTVVRTLFSIVALLTAADITVLWLKYRHAHDYLLGLNPLFDFNREGNLPAFFSACALLIVCLLFLAVADHVKATGDRWYRHWLGLGLVFFFLAVDEAAELHGILSEPLRQAFHLSGALYFAWVVPYSLLTGLLAIAYARFIGALPPSTRAQLIVAAVVYVAGAVGFELLGGMVVSARGGIETGLDNWQHAVAYTLEELLEMVGVVLAIRALLEHIANERIAISLRLADD